jgi:glycosyltransferase involved in cell wall biosynthesis
MSARPLVLVVTSTLPRWTGDSEPRFVLDLCEALSARYRIIVLAPHCRGAAVAERFGDVEVRRFRYFPEWGETLAYEGGMLPKLRQRLFLWGLVPFFLVALVAAVARVLRREPVALVHAHWLIPQGLCVRIAQLLTGHRAPLVCTAHGADVFGLRGRMAAALQRWVARACVQVGAVSSALRDELIRRGVAADKITLTPMGVAVPELPADPPRRDQPVIAFAGRLVEKKGVDVLLGAFRQLVAQVPDARLVVAGGGPELARYRQLAMSMGLTQRIEFLGPVPQAEIRTLFGRAAVAVLPSITARGGDAEGLPLVMLEAMAAGCPLVTSDIPAVRGVIRAGENGSVFPERDETALAATLLDLLRNRDRAARLAATAYRDVKARFGWASVASNHAAIYAHATGI